MSEYQTQPQPAARPMPSHPPTAFDAPYSPAPAPPPVKKPRGRIVTPLIVGAVTFFIGLGVGLAGGGAETDSAANPQPDTTKVVTVPAAPAATPAAAVTTKAVPAAPAPVTVEDGIWTIGTDIPAGKYRVTEPVLAENNCYWAIFKSGTNGEDIISNDLPSGGRPTVTLRKGQDFSTERCGIWQKIG